MHTKRLSVAQLSGKMSKTENTLRQEMVEWGPWRSDSFICRFSMNYDQFERWQTLVM